MSFHFNLKLKREVKPLILNEAVGMPILVLNSLGIENLNRKSKPPKINEMFSEFDFILLLKFRLSAGNDLIVQQKWPFKTNCLEE